MTYPEHQPEPIRCPGLDAQDWRQVTRTGDSWPRRRSKQRRRARGTRKERR